MYNMSITSFGVLIEILLCLRGCRAEPIVSCPSGNVNVGSTVVLTCTINPIEAMTWKRDTDALANCDTFNCAVISSPGRYTFATDSGGQTVKITIAPVEPDDDNKEFTCVTSTSSDSCKFSVSSTTMASTTVRAVSDVDVDVFAGLSGGIALGLIVVIVVIIVATLPGDKWRNNFELGPELRQLELLNGRRANDNWGSCVLACVIEVCSMCGDETLSHDETHILAGKLKSVLKDNLHAAVTVNEFNYTIKLPCRSLTVLLKVIDLILGDEWKESLRKMEQNHQCTLLRTQFNADSFRACVKYYEEKWRRGFKSISDLSQQLKHLNANLEENLKKPYELVYVIEVSSTTDANAKLSAQEELILASKLESVLKDNLDAAVEVMKPDITTKLLCRSLNTLLSVLDLIQKHQWNTVLLEIGKNHQHTELKTMVDALSFRVCVKYFKDKWRREFKLDHELDRLTDLNKSFVKDANDRTTLCVLVCVLEVSSTSNKNEQLGVPEKKKLARNLASVLKSDVKGEVNLDMHGYTIELRGCSLTALLKVIELIRGDEWNECLREMEKTLQNTTLRTQFEEDSFRTCVANFEDLLKKNS